MHNAALDEGSGSGDVVVIGVDPHKASVTLEARDTREILRATGTFPTTVWPRARIALASTSPWRTAPRRCRPAS